MTAEAIAKVVADMRDKRARSLGDEKMYRFASDLVVQPTVIDATEIYRSAAETPKEIYIYEDHPCIAPPWKEAIVAYVNQHENVVAMHVYAQDHKAGTAAWEGAQESCNWDNVRWIVWAFVWLGGMSNKTGRSFPTSGPAHLWQLAVGKDGTPEDIHWLHLQQDYPMEFWDMAQVTLLGALNFMNCRNVELVEPKRPRPELRRLQRVGVSVKTINVFPIGKSSQGSSKGDGLGIPLTSVRGHFARYGEEYGRGKLFGKLSGRFWIPQYARGDATLGEQEHDYKLVSSGLVTDLDTSSH